jgi:hypothetical protein
MSIERFEEEFLKGADKCYVCSAPLESFKKYTAGIEFMWIGWCSSCHKDIVVIHGNNPSETKD